MKNELSETRHNTIAHREADALHQYEMMSNLNIMNFSTALADFYEASDNLLKSLICGMLEIGSINSMLHQVTYSKKIPNK